MGRQRGREEPPNDAKKAHLSAHGMRPVRDDDAWNFGQLSLLLAPAVVFLRLLFTGSGRIQTIPSIPRARRPVFRTSSVTSVAAIDGSHGL